MHIHVLILSKGLEGKPEILHIKTQRERDTQTCFVFETSLSPLVGKMYLEAFTTQTETYNMIISIGCL